MYFDSGSCQYRSAPSGSDNDDEEEASMWLYCQVCIFWSTSRDSCLKSEDEAYGGVCSADRFFPVIPDAGEAPLVGETTTQQNWSTGLQSEYGAVKEAALMAS